MNPLLEAALHYAALGFPVFPCHNPVQTPGGPQCSCPNSDCAKSNNACKHPRTEHGFHDASTDPEVIRGWWTRWPEANIGVAVPEGYVVLDVDGQEPRGYLKAFELVVPATATQRTPRGSHFIFRLPPGVRIRQTSGELFAGIDTRAAGSGYFIAAPSVSIDGVVYEWTVPLEENNISDAPDWLIEKFGTHQPAAAAREVQPEPQPTSNPLEGCPRGQRHGTLVRLARRWRLAGLTPHEEWALAEKFVQSCQQPPGAPFTEEEARGILRWAWDNVTPGGRVNQEQQEARQDEQIRVYSLEEFRHLQLPPREAILEGFLYTRDLAMVVAERGRGKSWVAEGAAIAVASGGRFLRWSAPQPRDVLLVDGEMDHEDLRARFTQLQGDNQASNGRLRILSSMVQSVRLPSLSTPRGRAIVERHLGEAALLILDNRSALFGGEENDSRAWDEAQNWFLDLRRRGKAVLLVHHAGKSGKQRGTSRHEDVLNVVIELKWPNDYRNTDGARFEVRFTKDRAFVAGGYFEAQLTTDPNGRQVWTTKDLDDVTYDKVVELTKDGLGLDEVAERLGVHRTTVFRHRRKAVQQGDLLPEDSEA